MTTLTNESNVAYDRRQRAGKLLIEAPKGAMFQYEADKNVWLPCNARSAASFIMFGHDVRTAPTPKKVLRPAWEILRDATSNGLVRTYAGETLIYKNAGFQITLADIFAHEGMPQDELNAEWPDWFFIEEAKG
jgi:hypothetical protein